MLNSVFQMIAPHYCIQCNTRGAIVCEKCMQKLLTPATERCYRCNALSPGFRTCRSCRSSSDIFALSFVGFYEEPLRGLIAKTKYRSARDGCREIARLIAQAAPKHHVDVITWVPTAHRHIRQRGFDHARLLAFELAHELQLPCRQLLLRDKQVTQVGASRRKRRLQMRDAFRNTGAANQYRRVLLVDDVVSTAATVEAAAHTLRQAGVKRVVAAVAARNR